MKQNKKNKISGIEAFDSYYTEIYGDRWQELKASLCKENVYVKFLHSGKTISEEEEGEIPCQEYFLDPASVCAALSLPVNDSDKVLDLCAAPGGKSLILSSVLPDNGCLFSNERSPDRKKRLAKVIATCLPRETSSRVTVSCSDGALWCRRESEAYDSILLDAPCSSERHVLNDEKYLKDWTPNRVKTMTIEQWALLSSAFRLLKKGGYMVYSTCALAEEENDKILQRLVKKFPQVQFMSFEEVKAVFDSNAEKLENLLFYPDRDGEKALSLVQSTFQKAHKTQYGFHILPDTGEGAGPIFFSLLRKN